MTVIKRKINVIGINSFKFKDLPINLQNLFIETNKIAVPHSYIKDIKLWLKNKSKEKKELFASDRKKS